MAINFDPISERELLSCQHFATCAIRSPTDDADRLSRIPSHLGADNNFRTIFRTESDTNGEQIGHAIADHDEYSLRIDM